MSPQFVGAVEVYSKCITCDAEANLEGDAGAARPAYFLQSLAFLQSLLRTTNCVI